jgi:hypothetical protein
MQLNKTTKILVGLGTLWFILSPFLILALCLLMMTGIGISSQYPESATPLFLVPFLFLFPIQFFTYLDQVGLMAFYLVHLIKNSTAPETARILLGLGFYFIPLLALPIYFYLYVWQDPPPARAMAQVTPPS